MAVPIKVADISKISRGNEVEINTVDNVKIYKGKIVRINSTVDQQTQSVQVYIQSSEKGILDGLFFNVAIKVQSDKKLARLPPQAIRNGNQVKVKKDESTKLVDVTIIEKTATDYLVIGLEDGALVILDNSAN